MKSDAKQLLPVPDFMLPVELADGRRGVFDLKPHLHWPGFNALRNPTCLAQLQALVGAATRPDGEDVASESSAAELSIEGHGIGMNARCVRRHCLSPDRSPGACMRLTHRHLGKTNQ